MNAIATSTIEATEAVEMPVIEFAAPIPGFPASQRFVLVRVTEEGVLFALTSVEQPDLRFLVVPPAPFFPDYELEIDDEAMAAIGATDKDAESLLVLLMVTAGDTAGSSTANLMAPIVLNQETRMAVQMVLVGSGLPIRAPLMPA